jgi:hypothetical protein
MDKRQKKNESQQQCRKCGSELMIIHFQIQEGFDSWLVCKKATQAMIFYIYSDEGDQKESIISIKKRMMKGHYHEKMTIDKAKGNLYNLIML